MSLSTEKRKEAVENIRRIFGENLTKALRQCGKTQSDLVEHLGVSKGAVSQWCNGYRTPSPDTVDKIVEYLNITKEDLIREELPSSNVRAFTPFVQVPLFASVSAGLGTTREEPIGEYMAVVRSREEAENTLCVIVDGDSMTPEIQSGDILQVHCQSSVDSGDLAVVTVDGEHFVKKVVYGPEFIRLISYNKDYEPIVLKGKDVLRCSVKGKVKKIMRDPK